ncbi:thioredoxin [Moesziomyces antarcticus T-34]|uniref:Thioredoxin n=1 Tax=Pseudozyma antarctica (strain T-34) TaxID=1151754 RepID=M9LWB9_PSEA3|nr:thioredoxin [Moesziomyces antarcticus T-34]
MLSRAIRIPTASLRGARSFSASTRTAKVYENVDAATFNARVLQPSGAEADVPVLVDFFATWCQPCKLLSPALKKVATQKDLVGKQVDLVTIDVDQHQDIAQQFKVSFPIPPDGVKTKRIADIVVACRSRLCLPSSQ